MNWCPVSVYFFKYEGIDLKAVRHIHVFEPLVTMASDLQTIGRARRYCSHSDLERDSDEWIVHVHRYFAEVPKTLDVVGARRGNAQKAEDENVVLAKELAAEIENLDGKLGALKGKKDAESKSTREEIKIKLKDLKEQKKVVDKLAKESNAVAKKQKRRGKAIDTSNIANVDDFIYDEAREKMKELLTIYLCMKEAAIDCRLLNTFHSMDENNAFTCAF